MDPFQGLPQDIIEKIKALKVGKDDGGQAIVDKFAKQIEDEVSSACVARFIRKLLPLSTAPSAITVAIRNATGLSNHVMTIDRRPFNCLILFIHKESEKSKFFQRQSFI